MSKRELRHSCPFTNICWKQMTTPHAWNVLFFLQSPFRSRFSLTSPHQQACGVGTKESAADKTEPQREETTTSDESCGLKLVRREATSGYGTHTAVT